MKRRILLWLGTAACAIALAVPAQAIPPVPPLPTPPGGGGNPFIPPVGNQPPDPVRSCSFRALGVGEIRPIFVLSNESGPAASKTTTGFSVDPSQPCHMYRSVRNGLVRSDDSGATFHPDFVDNTGGNTINHGPISSSPVVGAGGGEIFFYDMSGNNGVFHSNSYGNTDWDERDNGLYAGGGLGPSGGITDFVQAPSNPKRIYMVGASGANKILYVTDDGGLNWGTLAVPSTDISSVAVDPGDENHIYLSGDATGGRLGVYYESGNAGNNVTQQPGPPGELSPSQLLVTRAGGSVRLYAQTTNTGVERLWRLDAGTWKPLLIPDGVTGRLDIQYNHRNPLEMVLAAAGTGPDGHKGVELAASFDGFQSNRYSKFVDLGNAGASDIQMTADSGGDYFLQLTANNTNYVVAFRAVGLQPPPPPPPGTGGIPLRPEIGRCDLQPLPDVTPPASPSNPVPQPGPPKYLSGSVAFDGRYLDYTQDELSPGVIYRTNPKDCTHGTPFHVPPSATDNHLMPFYAISFDPKFVFPSGHEGALLVRGAAGPSRDQRTPFGYAAVYAVDPQSDPAAATAVLMTSVYCTADNKDICSPDPNMFAYDPYRDQIWATIDDGPAYGDQPGLVSTRLTHGAPAPTVPTCLTSFRVPGSVNGQQIPNPNITMVVPGARDILYAQLEDDITVLRLNSANCQVLDGFTHKHFSEGDNEDDAMACDSLTYGRGSNQGTPTSVLWIRDVLANDVKGYEIPDGFCPFPTDLRLTGVPGARVGDAITVCADLAATTAGLRAPIAGETVTFSVGGHSVGSAQTDPNGRACIAFTVPGSPGGFPVVATFGGNEAYLPATATGVLSVTSVAANPPPNPPGARLAPPVHAPAPPLAVVPPPPAAAQAASQAQSQAQIQSQLQGQPGMMTQKQKQARVALQKISGEKVETTLEASRYQAAAIVQFIGITMFGLALYGRKRQLRKRMPRPAFSRVTHRPRRR